MSTIQESIEKLLKNKDTIEKEVLRLNNILIKYPDTMEAIDRWGVVRLKSKSVNSIVTNCDIKHSCGCCNDSPLKIWPYINTEFGKIFSDPCGIVIGEKDYDGGDIEQNNWRELLIKENIPNVIIKIAEKYFMDNLPYEKLKEMLGVANE